MFLTVRVVDLNNAACAEGWGWGDTPNHLLSALVLRRCTDFGTRMIESPSSS